MIVAAAHNQCRREFTSGIAPGQRNTNQFTFFSRDMKLLDFAYRGRFRNAAA